MNELLDNVMITDEFLEGMKVVGKALAKKCKGQYTYIQELKNKSRYSYDFEYIREEEDKLAHYVEMKVLAEKFYKKAKHIKEERENEQIECRR